MSLPRTKASSVSRHSYCSLGQDDPDSPFTLDTGKQTYQDQAEDSEDDSTNKSHDAADPIVTLRHRPTRSGDNRDSSTESYNREPFSKRTDRRQYWILYILAGILIILAVSITSLILKPWQPKYRLAPIWNDAVKALPDEQPLLPIPRSFTFGKDKVLLNRDFRIKVRTATGFQELSTAPYPILEKAIARCMERLEVKRRTTPFSTVAVTSSSLEAARPFTLSELTITVKNAKEALKYGMGESYTMDIAVKDTKVGARAVLTATTQWGVLHGLETFLQLVQVGKSSSAGSTTKEDQTIGNPLEIPNVPWSIQDWPRYSHRGLLLDTSRHYIHVKDILRTLDAMSIVKLNVFHWHILDQQTYPLVSKTFPDLSAKGAERPDFIYTSEDVAAIIKHGEEASILLRGIRVLPEFDAPGHTASWGRAYPNITLCLDMEPHPEYGAEPPAGQLDPLAPFTYTLLNGLIKEWAEQFPDEQVHAGGDEINYKCWKTSDRVRDYVTDPNRRAEYEKALPPAWKSPLKENKMKRTKHGAQPAEDRLLEVYLNRAMGMYLSQGKRPIVWEELALEHNVKLPANAIVQVWKDAGNAKRVYSYKLDDELDAEQQKLVYGGEVCMWGELTDSANLDSKIWPRSAAAAEILWSDHQDEHGQARPLMHVAKRLDAIREQLVQMGVGATPLYPSWCSKHPEGCLSL
ncbi:hypothetical protein BGX34_005301 [Mortierella sp. NVP85]|nr:hypothetical protein BGX34_005301 [Mortierella sp. NVP85]